MVQEQRGQPSVSNAAVRPRMVLVPGSCRDGTSRTLIAHEPPAGQGAGRLLDIVLGIMADAEREQLHQLAGQVLVGMALGVLGASSQISRAGSRSIACRSWPNGARQSERRVSFCRRIKARSSTLRLLVAKWSCHIEREPLGERVGAEEHAVDPPALEATGLGHGQGQVGQAVGERGEIRGEPQDRDFPSSSRLIDGFGAVVQVALGARPRWRRSRPGGAGGRPGAGSRAACSRGDRVPRDRRGKHSAWLRSGNDAYCGASGVTTTSPRSRTSPGSAVRPFRASPADKRTCRCAVELTLKSVLISFRRPSIWKRPAASAVKTSWSGQTRSGPIKSRGIPSGHEIDALSLAPERG